MDNYCFNYWVVFLFIKKASLFKTPAPKGIHGEYALTNNSPIYQTNLNKDSLLLKLTEEKLIVKPGQLDNYGAPWDSLRYLIDQIPCNQQKIEAYIEFFDSGRANTKFRVLWFNASTTTNNEVYEQLTRNYYECFEKLLKKYGIIK